MQFGYRVNFQGNIYTLMYLEEALEGENDDGWIKDHGWVNAKDTGIIFDNVDDVLWACLVFDGFVNNK